jgi:hypothetical protein
MSFAELFSRDAPARYIEGRRQRFPPIYMTTSKDWHGLFAVALNLSTPALRAMAASKLIASGEIGELTPSTYVSRKGSGYAVEMHSGAMRLIYSAARAMVTSDSGRFRDDKSSSSSAAEIAAHIADLFQNFEHYNIATVQSFAATPFQLRVADMITKSAERFLLLHELAHIHNGDLSRWRGFFGLSGTSRDREAAADATACQWMVDYLLNPTPDGPPPKLFYAGAEFGLRVRMAMETTGMRFNNTHPAAGDRVAAMRARLRAAAGAGAFYQIANTSIAFDNMWRAIELILRGKPPKFEAGLDDVVAGLWTLTVEAAAAGQDALQIREDSARPGMKQAVFSPMNPRQQEIQRSASVDFRDLSPELRAAVKQKADEIFEPNTGEHILFLLLLSLSESSGSSP